MTVLGPTQQELLRRRFPPALVGRLPKTEKRPALDYVGHAAVTDRLIAVDPEWTFTVDERFDHAGECWIRVTLTVCGVSRPEYGDGKDPKEALGNALRRAAMRFGVALDLWSKEELIEASSSPTQRSDPESPTVTSGRGGDKRGGEGKADEGEAPAEASPSPPQTPSGQPEGHHEHNWKPSPTLAGWHYCTVKGCGRAERIPEGVTA